MSILSLLSLAAAVFVLAITPGPGVLATVARGMASGFAPAAAVAAGIVCGDLVFLILALFGLSAIADLLGDFFLLVRYLGSAYLIFLGLRLLLSRPRHLPEEPVTGRAAGNNFLSGLAITLGNPKVILFYLGFLPGFLNLQQIDTASIFLIAAIVSMVLGSVLLGYGFLAAQSKAFLTGCRAGRALNRGSGAIMITTGSMLLATTKP